MSKNPAWWGTVVQGANALGVDPATIRAIGVIESGLRDHAKAPTSTAYGPFQFLRGTWNGFSAQYPQLGLTSRKDPLQQAKAIPYWVRDINEGLRRRTGRAPTPGETYLGHFLGLGGAGSILKYSDDTPITTAVPAKARAANRWVFDKMRTVGDLKAWANQKMAKAGAASVASAPTPAPGGGGPDPFLAAAMETQSQDGPVSIPFPESPASDLLTAPAPSYAAFADEPGALAGFSDAVSVPLIGGEREDTLLDAAAPAPLIEGAPRIEMLDALTASSLTEEEQRHLDRIVEGQTFGHLEGAWEAVKDSWGASWAFDGAEEFLPDPDYKLDDNSLRELAQDIPSDYWDQFRLATSEAHAAHIRQRLLEDLETERGLAGLGKAGIGYRILGALSDPLGWLATAATGPIGGSAKAARIARVLKGAAQGATGNLAAELPIYMNKPTATLTQLFAATALGAGLGGALGSLGRGLGTAGEARTLSRLGDEVADGVERFGPDAATAPIRAENGIIKTPLDESYTPPKDMVVDPPRSSTVGAAQASVREPVRADVYDFLGPQMEDAFQRPVFGSARYDLSANLTRSENPLTRALGNFLVEDAVGKADGRVTPFSVSEEATALRLRSSTAWNREFKSAFDTYAERMGLNWRAKMREERTFREQVTAAVRSSDPNARFDPEVQQAANAFREQMATWAQRLQNPGWRDNTVRRSVRGAENLGVDPTYVPRIIDFEKFQAMSVDLGDRSMRQLVEGAVRSAMPELEQEIAAKIAKGYMKRLRSVHAGQELTGMRGFSADTSDTLREALEEAGELDMAEIDDIVARFTRPSETEGSSPRLKRRTVLNEDFRMMVPDKNGIEREVGITDFLQNDAHFLMETYSRQTSAQVAMARLRIEDPRWVPEDGPEGRWLIDGVTSKAEWDLAMKKVAAVWDEISPGNLASRDRDLKNLDFAYRAIMGVPDEFDATQAGQALRMIRDYNFIRLMGQVGWAQIAEAGVVTGTLGLKAAMQGIPALRTLVRNARTGKLDDALAEEIEWITSAGTDWLRGQSLQRMDDFSNPLNTIGMNHRLAQADTFLQHGKRVTSALSGMAPVNTFLQRWAGKAMFAKFANMAAGADKANLKRLAAMGMDETMANRVFDQIRTHASYVKGDLNGSNLRRMNVEKWDPEVAAAFENTASRWLRRVIQENDVGQMNRILGSAWGKVFFQFRTFVLSAWTKQFLHNVHMRDWETFATFSASMVFGGMAYAAQTSLQSVGRSDQKEFLQERLSLQKIASASFQRAGYASFIPQIWDTGANILGFDPLFDTRASGTPSSFITGNPTVSLGNQVLELVREINRVGQGDPFSQSDMRATQRITPFQNVLPMAMLYQSLIGASGAPEWDPFED